LYVLATEDRCVEAVDVDSNQPVSVPLEITVAASQQHAETTDTRVTPCLLPERTHLKRVRVCGPR
jgi:anaphase-promoting complex subunit 1